MRRAPPNIAGQLLLATLITLAGAAVFVGALWWMTR